MERGEKRLSHERHTKPIRGDVVTDLWELLLERLESGVTLVQHDLNLAIVQIDSAYKETDQSLLSSLKHRGNQAVLESARAMRDCDEVMDYDINNVIRMSEAYEEAKRLLESYDSDRGEIPDTQN